MNQEEKEKALVFFQANCFKCHRTLGFNVDNANSIFGIIIEMRNIVVAAEQRDTILLHKHMGLCAEALANYASTNSIHLKDAVGQETHESMTANTSALDLEFYLEKIRDDLSFIKDMTEEEKTEFIQKTWVCIFPEEYHDDFIKVERILTKAIKDNEIKYPELYSNKQ